MSGHTTAPMGLQDIDATYVNICNPAQSANHGRLWDSVSGIENKDEGSEATDGLRWCRRLERRSQRAEPRPHHDRHREHEQEEYTIKSSQLHVVW